MHQESIHVEDLRRYPRYDAHIPVTVSIRDENITSQTLNISQGGLSLRTALPIPTGTLVNVNIDLPQQDDTVQLSGMVVGQYPATDKQYTICVEFHFLDENTYSLWRNVIAMQ